ncbi:MAG: phosphate acyltransferase, partial [Gammaproteobacteria bacterium]|nr:phosphate acyltransferase [Gammaproteobacteria bacterium]
MGGDFGPREIVPATSSIIKKYSDLTIALVGREEDLVTELDKA